MIQPNLSLKGELDLSRAGTGLLQQEVASMAMKAAKRGVEQHAAQLGLPAAASVVVCCAVWALKQWKRRRQDRDSPTAAPEASPAGVQSAVGEWVSYSSAQLTS